MLVRCWLDAGDLLAISLSVASLYVESGSRKHLQDPLPCLNRTTSSNPLVTNRSITLLSLLVLTFRRAANFSEAMFSVIREPECLH